MVQRVMLAEVVEATKQLMVHLAAFGVLVANSRIYTLSVLASTVCHNRATCCGNYERQQ